jgi:hypothetical protein
MKFKYSRIMVILLSTLIFSGCTKDEVNIQDEYFDQYSGELFSIVNQEENKYFSELGILYTVSLINVEPSMRDSYIAYNESNQTIEEMIIVSDRTKVFRMIDQNRKQLIQNEEVKHYMGKKIEYWVQPLKEHPEWLEAIELNIKG